MMAKDLPGLRFESALCNAFIPISGTFRIFGYGVGMQFGLVPEVRGYRVAERGNSSPKKL